MDFIERILGIAPDNGSGILEFLLFFLPLVTLAMLFKHRRAATLEEHSDQ